MHELKEHLTMGQAARLAPGHPSPSCIWRWCRKGVKSRAGDRVHLRHVRIGGVIYTTAAWMQEFGQRLAEADARHFDLTDQDQAPPTPGRAQAYTSRQRQAHLAQVDAELREAGL